MITEIVRPPKFTTTQFREDESGFGRFHGRDAENHAEVTAWSGPAKDEISVVVQFAPAGERQCYVLRAVDTNADRALYNAAVRAVYVAAADRDGRCDRLASMAARRAT